MDTLYFVLLVAHIVFGYISLSAGTFILFANKGTKLHQRIGNVFYFSLWGVIIASTFISIYKNIPFLFFMGNFVLYQNYSGRRVLKNKSHLPNWGDYAILVFALLNGAYMVYTLNIVLTVFGALTLFLVFSDARLIFLAKTNKKIHQKAWLSKHLGMMMGAYIGTLTAFIVVNVNDFQPAWLLWLLPTFLLVPLMRYWDWKFTRKGI